MRFDVVYNRGHYRSIFSQTLDAKRMLSQVLPAIALPGSSITPLGSRTSFMVILPCCLLPVLLTIATPVISKVRTVRLPTGTGGLARHDKYLSSPFQKTTASKLILNLP